MAASHAGRLSHSSDYEPLSESLSLLPAAPREEKGVQTRARRRRPSKRQAARLRELLEALLGSQAALEALNE